MRRLIIHLAVLLCLVATVGAPSAQPATPRLGYIIEFEFDPAEQGAGVRVQQRKAAVAAQLGRAGVNTHVYSALPYVYADRLPKGARRALGAQAGVRAIYREEFRSALTAQSLARIGQPRAAAAGATGAGFAVAVLDTGADYRDPDLGACTAAGPACRVTVAFDAAKQDNMLDDSVRHGTNVSAVVARTAPRAAIIAIDVFDGRLAQDRDVLIALDWVYRNRTAHSITAVNMSLGSNPSTQACQRIAYDAAFRLLSQAGVAIVAATGNNASKDRILAPACHPQAISVGATTDTVLPAAQFPSCRDPGGAADRVACFSNSASFLTLLAPGHAITAGSVTQSGTSQAAPHVAAAIAALRSAPPGRTSAQALALLKNTGTMITDTNGVRTPRIDLGRATNLPPVAVADTAEALQGGGVVVSVLDNDRDEAAAQLKLELGTLPAGLRAQVVGSRLYVLAEPGVTGTKTFRYRIVDDYGASAEAQVSVAIRRAVMANPVELSAKAVALASATTDQGRYLFWIEATGDRQKVVQHEIGAAGSPVGTPYVISADGPLGSLDLAAFSYEDEYTVAWTQGRGSNSRVLAGTYSATQLGAPFLASFSANEQVTEATVVGLRPGPVVGWRRANNPTKFYAHAFSRGVNPSPEGSLQSLSNYVALPADTAASAAVRLSPTTYMFLFRSASSVLAQRFDDKGNPAWTAWKPLTPGATVTVYDFAAAAEPAGLAMVWSSYTPRSRWELLFQRFDANGKPLTATPVTVLPDWSILSRVRLIRLGNGGFRLVWPEVNGSLRAIMSRSISATGALGPLRIDAWTFDAALAHASVDALPLGATAYQLSWFSPSGRMRTQARDSF